MADGLGLLASALAQPAGETQHSEQENARENHVSGKGGILDHGGPSPRIK